MSYDSGTTTYTYLSGETGYGDLKEYTNQYGDYTHVQGEIYNSETETTSYVDYYVEHYSGK